jgi:anti-anti-sigma factor
MSIAEGTRRDVGPAGGWHELTSEVQLTPEVGMALTLVLTDTSVGRPHAGSPAFRCSATDSGADAAWVRASGELDVAAVPVLARTLREVQGPARLVVLDLRELKIIVTAGVRAIVTAAAAARRVGARLVVLRGTPLVDRMFELTDGSGDIEMRELDQGEPAVQVLLQLATTELALRAPAGFPRLAVLPPAAR